MVGNGGYIAQAKELELMRRDNVRMVNEMAQKDAALDHMRTQVTDLQCTARELNALMRHHIRSSFMLGLGLGVMAAIMFWGIGLLLR